MPAGTFTFLSHVCVIYLFFHVQSVASEENLSLRKNALQSTTLHYNWTADKVVDGCLRQQIGSDCCSHTSHGTIQAWWQVDLRIRATISYITIYYRDEGLNKQRDRFAGYQLYLSNITDWKTGVLCYEDTSSNETEVETVITHQCPYVAQYVTIYNYRGNPKRHDWYSDDALLELCEVQIYGCPRQKYGYGNCNDVCPDGCYQGICDASTGSCLYCPPGKWGNVCDMDCHSDCNGGCDVDNGSCTVSTEQCIRTEDFTVVAVLATIAGLCLITAIVLFVLLLRSRSILRKEREKDAQYEGIDFGGRIAPNIYESATSTISTN